MSYMAQRVSHFGVTIFTEMTALAQKHQAVNLGQGFPDFPAPDFVKEAAARAVHNDINQYAPRSGLPQLREAVANKVNKHDNLNVTAEDVTILHGATESIFATIMGLVDPGDEVILFEPYYDSYIPSVEFAGGIPRFYTLSAPDWHIDAAELEALFNDKTKMIVINTPHNPTGKVYSHEELQLIADLCQKYDVIAVVDSVYEHIVFDDAKHYTLATFPGMKERTVTISSLGKTFSVTGWKLGWTIAPPDLTQGIVSGHQFITFCSVAPLQAAAAEMFAWAERTGYYEELATMYQKKRDFLLEILNDVGLPTIQPKGTYFAMVDISQLGFANDVEFCRYLTTQVGVAAIPPSAFYQNPADGATVARFTFCKTDEALQEAAVRLRNWQR
ncbi:MAG: aminotransferase class I/II-fold pyridoxal phosphate-dependent enzyme [Anaerolineales bacterium]|nr:aminotransferase class I/II-fold pyridoxal phosphate-dependent enzyme [Anaerolineales bacterium]